MTIKNVLFVLSLLVLNISLNAQATPTNLDGKVFLLENVSNGKALALNGYNMGQNGSLVHSWPMAPANHNEQWKFVSSGDGDNMYYIISNSPQARASKYLEVSSHELGRNGGKVQMWDFNNRSTGDNQVWIVNQSGDGTFNFTNAHANGKGAYALELSGNDLEKNGGKIQIWRNQGYKNQKWNLVPIGGSTNTLKAGESLSGDKKLFSANGKYMLRMQAEDGHLCVYHANNGQQGGFVWGSGQHGFSGSRLDMQTDGNLVVYDGAGAAKWNTETHPYFDAKFRNTANKPVKLVLEDDGSLKLYTASDAVMWSSK